RRIRNDLVVGVAELVAAHTVVRVSELVDCEGIRVLRDLGYHLAALDLVRRGGALITIAHRIADVAGDGGTVTNVPNIHVPIGRVANAELLAGDIVTYPVSLTNDKGLQLGVAQGSRTFGFQVGH